MVEGERLFLNCTSNFGELRVQVLTLEGQPVAAAEATVTADACKVEARFGDGFHFAQVSGKPVRLRFQLSNARLYAFWGE